MAELDETGELKLTISIGEIALSKDDLLIETEQKEGYCTLTQNGVTVAMDTNLTEELISEGFVREIISKIQTMRKDSGFEVMDHIEVAIDTDEKLAAVIDANKAQISTDVLANSITCGAADGGKEWDINGVKAVISVKKA